MTVPTTLTDDGMRAPDSSRPQLGGEQRKYKFANGYGASVIRNDMSYGGDIGLWEVAVLGKDGDLTYDTPVTSDVIGRLDVADVNVVLEQIEALA